MIYLSVSLRASGVTFSRAWQVVVHGRRARELTPHLFAVDPDRRCVRTVLTVITLFIVD